MAGAGVGDEVQISWRGGGWGGRSAPHSSTPDPKVSTGASQASQQLRVASESEIRVTSETLSTWESLLGSTFLGLDAEGLKLLRRGELD